MKKILSIILSIFIAATLLAMPVSAEFSADDIIVNTDVYDINVTVKSDNSGTMFAQLLNTDSTIVYDMDADSNPDYANNVYTYTFNFVMNESTPTAEYVIRVGNNVPKTSKSFNYVDINDKVVFYNNLDTVEANGIKAYFDSNASVVPVDVSVYNKALADGGISDEARLLVNKRIVSLDLDTGVEVTDAIDVKAPAVSAIDTLFAENFNDAMELTVLVDKTGDEWNAMANAKLNDESFDDKYYVSASDEEPLLDVSRVQAKFKSEIVLQDTLTDATCSVAFDNATLLMIEQETDWSLLKEAFLYFENKNIIAPDMADIDALVASNNDKEFWMALRDEANTTCDELVSNAERLAAAHSENDTDNDDENQQIGTPSLPTGGGGGGGGGFSKPTKPEVVEPEEPEKPENPEDTTTPSFNDIENVEWAKEAIEALAKEGIVSGRDKGVFAPNDSVSREEFIKMIVLAFDMHDEDADADFEDVDADRWSSSFIASASKSGIVSGDGTNFRPTEQISRQDMAVIIYRIFNLKEIEVLGDYVEFTDGTEISDYAKEAVEVLSSAEIINGMGDGTFAPKSSVTRAQAAKVIFGLLNLTRGE